MRIATMFVVALLALVMVDSAFVVTQWQQAIITRFGEPVREAIREPGLYFKVPIIEKVHRLDKRFLDWDGKVTEVQTKEKLLILVDTYARWRIIDPLVFYQRLQDVERAQSRLDGILNGATRDTVARHNLVELVRTSTDALPVETPAETPPDDPDTTDGATRAIENSDVSTLQPVQYGRAFLRQEILDSAAPQLAQLGIELLDVQFKRVNYIEDVARTVYQRMISERNRIADEFRSEGEGEALRIRGDKERELKRIRSEAFREAEEIVGRADAEAAEIYARAYDQSPDARDFYTFLKTMETYRTAFDGDTWMMLSTDSEFMRFLETDGGR